MNTQNPDQTNPSPALDANGDVVDTFINVNPADRATPDESDDPMIVEMRAAEAELAGTTTATAAEGENPPAAGTGGGNQPTPASTAPNPSEDNPSAMIPKARLDQVLAERDQWKQRAEYQQGVLDTQTKMISTGPAAPAAANGTPAPAAAAPQPTVDDRITAAENEKIELSKQYDAGDINTVEYQGKLVAIDREIRTLTNQSYTAQLEQVRTATTQASQKQLVEQQVMTDAAAIQAQHPYVAEIDKLPPAIRDGVWKTIDAEAQQNLAQRNINPHDGTVASRLALVAEKAALTNKYGPQYTGVAPASVNGTPAATHQPNQTPGQLSPAAQERLAKLETANNQPPATSAIGSAGIANELTSAQLEGLNEDEMADLLARAPAAVQRAAGL